MARVLITGVAGFTGRYLAAELKKAGHEVIGLVHRHVSDLTCCDTQHVVDLTDAPAVSDAVRAIRPEKTVHLAAIAFVAHDNVDEMYRTNIMGTRNLLQAHAQLNRPPDAVLVASSANVYGSAYVGSIDETMPPCPANDYGVTKVATENLVKIKKELPWIIVRPFNYTGVGQNLNFLVPKIIDHARRKEKILELGNIDVARDFSDVRTVVKIYAKLLNTPEATRQTVNVCSGAAITLRQIIAMVERLSHHKFEIRINPAFVRKNDVKLLSGNVDKLTDLMGTFDAPPFADTLRWMLEAL